MKGSEITVGKRYAAKVDFTEHVVVEVLQTGVARSHGYRAGQRKDGVHVRVVLPYNRWGVMHPAGAERTITSRDVMYEWTDEHQDRRQAREADASRAEERASAIRDALIERRLDGKVSAPGKSVTLSFDAVEHLFDISPAPPRKEDD